MSLGLSINNQLSKTSVTGSQDTRVDDLISASFKESWTNRPSDVTDDLNKEC